MWGDGWLPVNAVNPTLAVIMLHRNAKISDVEPCIALEDFDFVSQNVGMVFR